MAEAATVSSSTAPHPMHDATTSKIRPFEWLTSASSLDSILSKALETACSSSAAPARVLHVGSGSSILGEYLVSNRTRFHIERVVNVDKDGKTLSQMKQRWKESQPPTDQEDCLEFVEADFSSHNPIPLETASFDVCIDKSTLDCTLCSDEATAGLLTLVHRLLKPETGVYLLVSFHSIELLQPLLQDCPGADWLVTHTLLQRQVEDLVTGGQTNNKADCPIQEPLVFSTTTRTTPSTLWSTGSFEPDEAYRRTVNVLLCQRRGKETASQLDWQAVYRHIHQTNDQWFQSSNPLLTVQREQALEQAFAASLTTNHRLDLEECYRLLFTDAEREHLTYEYFLQDWNAFLETHPELPQREMSYETAVLFLKEMQ